MKSLFMLVLTLFLVACGSDKDNEVDIETNSVGGACGFQVVSDYNDVVLACKYMTTDADARSCKSKAQSFINKYPNINCEASRSSETSVDDETFTVTNHGFELIIEELERHGY